jgi:glutamate/tyrosine decarboxylase-like PLP-dependent enzyme
MLPLKMDVEPVNLPSVLSSLLQILQQLPLNSAELPTLPEDGTIVTARHSLPQTLPEHGHADWSEHLIRDITPAFNAASLSPNYYGFITGGCTPAALFGDMLASIYDQNVQVHLPMQTIATDVESCALNMLLHLFHLDRNVWGQSPTFTTGATASNVLGLAMGREWILRCKAEKRGSSFRSVGEHGIHEVMESAGVKKVQILSTMPHSSIAKAASIVGIGRANIVPVMKTSISGDFNIGIDFDRLEEEAKKTEIANILVISAGEVNTGRFATNGLAEMKTMRSICDQHDIWIHVDGAFGIFGRLFAPVDEAEFGEIFRGCQGLELADSITGDGHKLLNVPYDCGFYFCRHKGIAEEVFRNGNAAYLTSSATSGDISSPLNIGIENSRRCRALPVYAALQAYGRGGYVDMLKRQIRLARKVVEDLWDSEVYQLLPEASSKTDLLGKTFMVVLFRANEESLNADLVRRINATKRMYVSGTTWDGKPAARIAIANWNVDVERDHEIIQSVLWKIAEGR